MKNHLSSTAAIAAIGVFGEFGARATFTAVALAALAACSDSPDPAATTAPPPAAAALGLSGTAATGGAVAARGVEAKCRSGTGTATTAVDGSYSMSITSGTLPCAMRVTLADGSALHSLATGSGTTARANLTPVSQLAVARLSGGDPAALYAGFDATAAAALDNSAVQAAAAAVVQVLRDAGVDFSTAGDLFTAPLVAANGSTAGNAFDQALDLLRTRLAASGTTLAALAGTLARSSPAAPATALSGTPSLPAVQQLQPAAAHCAALRSGRYRYVVAMPTLNGQFETGVSTLNASTLTFSNGSDSTVITPVAGVPCRFSVADGSQIVVSQAGVLVISQPESGAMRMALAFPEQAITLAELTGEWNILGSTANGGSYTLSSATLTVSAAGAITSGQYCDNLRACLPVPSGNAFRANASGGFELYNSIDSGIDRAFAYRSGGGELMALFVAPDGTLSLLSRKRVNTLPALPAAANNTWGLTANNLGVTSGITDSSNTVISVNPINNTFVRNNIINSSTGLTRPETLTVNSPRDGYNTRHGETVTASDGSTSTVSEFVALGLRGAGLAAVAFPASNQFTVSVVKP